jgi:hypothetical protein
MKTIEELAREAGARELIDVARPFARRDLAFSANQLARFAALVRAQALEEAAQHIAPMWEWRGDRGSRPMRGSEAMKSAHPSAP